MLHIGNNIKAGYRDPNIIIKSYCLILKWKVMILSTVSTRNPTTHIEQVTNLHLRHKSGIYQY